MIRIWLGMVLGMLALPAFAHSPLLSSSPADGAALKTPPQVIDMQFKGTARLVRFALTGTASGDVPLGEDHLLVERHRHIIDLPAIGADGYEVRWRALSADGHVVTGAFSFTLQAD